MTAKESSRLTSLTDVVQYWYECLGGVSNNDMQAASRMVGVVSNERDEEWSKNPVYGLIFEIVAALETPFAGDTEQRKMQWDCVRALLPVMEQYADYAG